jgi:hypothetical protein
MQAQSTLPPSIGLRSKFTSERQAALKILSLTTGISLLILWRSSWTPTTYVILIAATGWSYGLLGIVFPLLTRPWVKIFSGLETGFRLTITTLCLGLAFFGVITPLSCIGKVFGNGFLGSKKAKLKPISYWIERGEDSTPSKPSGAEKKESWDRPY